MTTPFERSLRRRLRLGGALSLANILPGLSGVLLPAFVGETALSLWPMARGVHLQRWKP